MGAGAGYTITTNDTSLDGDIQIKSFDVVEDNGWLTTTVDCNVPLIGKVKAESYYDGCDYVNDVHMMVTGIVINFYKTPEYPEVTEDMIREVLENTVNYDGEGSYGGGWTHSTFDGTFELTDWHHYSYADDINKVTMTIPDKLVCEYLDRAVTGDNKIYNVIYNGEVYDGYSNDDDAIQALKELIAEGIKIGGPESVDFSECYVDWEYDVLVNEMGEADVVYPGGENIVYTADGDPDYEDYV